MPENTGFCIYKNTVSDRRVIDTQLDAAAEIVINESPFHQGESENASIPLEIFGDNQYIKDLNKDGLIDKNDMIEWFKQIDSADGIEDGTIQPDSANSDYLDLLGFKSGKNTELQDKGHVRSTEKGLEKLNEHADKFYFIFAKLFVINNMAKPEFIDYILENDSTRKLLAETQKLNPGFVRDLFEQAYNKDKNVISAKKNLLNKK